MSLPRNRAYHFVAPIAVSLFFAGCATMTPEQKGVATGTTVAGVRIAVGLLRNENLAYVVPQAMMMGAQAGYVTYVVEKRRATAYEARIAAQRARAYEERLSRAPVAKRKPKSRYVAVDAPRTSQSAGAASVMIWDTKANALVSTEVYDLKTCPPVGHVSSFEEYQAEYVAKGQ